MLQTVDSAVTEVQNEVLHLCGPSCVFGEAHLNCPGQKLFFFQACMFFFKNGGEFIETEGGFVSY